MLETAENGTFLAVDCVFIALDAIKNIAKMS